MAAIYSLYIINKSGGLIFYKDYGSAGRMDTNDSLRLASLWHSMHAISQQLSPIAGCTGIELLEADTFDLHCFQSLTGTPPAQSLLKHMPAQSLLKHMAIGFLGNKGKTTPPPVSEADTTFLIDDVMYTLLPWLLLLLQGCYIFVKENWSIPWQINFIGTKFFVVCEPGAQHMDALLKHIYELYTDYVLKNPFYEMEMPIRCELFDINLAQAVQKDRVALMAR